MSGVFFKHDGIVSYFMTMTEMYVRRAAMGILKWRHPGEAWPAHWRNTRDLFSEVPLEAPLMDQYVE